jgi:hypothetical protein
VPPGAEGLGGALLEAAPADFERIVDQLRRQGIAVAGRPQQPGYMDAAEGVGGYLLDLDRNLIELWAPRSAPAST